jgi:hypothetical protein
MYGSLPVETGSLLNSETKRVNWLICFQNVCIYKYVLMRWAVMLKYNRKRLMKSAEEHCYRHTTHIESLYFFFFSMNHTNYYKHRHEFSMTNSVWTSIEFNIPVCRNRMPQQHKYIKSCQTQNLCSEYHLNERRGNLFLSLCRNTGVPKNI